MRVLKHVGWRLNESTSVVASASANSNMCRSRSRRAAFSQTAGQEVWRPGSDDRDQDPLPDSTQTQIQELPGDLTPLSSEFSVSVSTGQAHRKKAWQSSSQQRTDNGRPSTSSKRSRREKPTGCRKRKGIVSFLNRVWKATKSNFYCCCHSCAVDVVEPFVPPPDLEPKPDPEPSSPAPDLSGVKPNNGRSRSLRTASTDSSPGITLSSSSLSLSEDNVERRFCGEWLSLSSRGSYIVEWRWSGDISDSRNEQSNRSNCCLSRSDSLEGFLCPPLSGQVPVEPTETETNGRTAQGAMEDSPVNKSSTVSVESLYNIGKMIGSGGFGRVFNATRKFDGKKVAIKQMRKIDNDRYLDIPGHPEPLVSEVALLLMMRR